MRSRSGTGDVYTWAGSTGQSALRSRAGNVYSYVGWFYWSVGTQVTLLNPVCLMVYALASWTFFRERVYAEELTLLSFFGEKYAAYQRAVGTGLPAIRGCVPGVQQDLREDHWSY
ncbi:hypothetical protein evm_014716 [Chilo suppressalis]|nr:hypothetical protein evm_014716 [Chilo suppressalis]